MSLVALIFFLTVAGHDRQCDVPAKALGHLQLSEKLESLSENPVRFTHPAYPDRTFRLVIQTDFVSSGIMASDEDQSLLAYVEVLPKKAGEASTIVAMATGIKVNEAGIEVGWVNLFDNRKLLARAKDFQKQIRPGASLLDAIAIHMMIGSGDETHSQLKFLYGYFKHHAQEMSDRQVEDYFSADKTYEGLGYAITEYLRMAVPIGSEISFDVAHAKTDEMLHQGKAWEKTTLGRMTKRNGTVFVKQEPAGRNGSHFRVTVRKESEAPTFFDWKKD